MNVLLIGSGGREHALAWKIAQSPLVKNLYCAPGNPGLAKLARCVDIGVNDFHGLLGLAREHDIGLTVVGPEDPLARGIVDVFTASGLKIFGPSAAAARIESSKAFAKRLMQANGIPTAAYAEFEDADEAKAYVREHGAPIVVKADGLAAGKGVTVAVSEGEAVAAIDAAIRDRAFGAAGARIVLEDLLIGEEASIFSLTDGEHILSLASCQDHKRVFDGDYGPNTGGMGAYSPAPIVTPALFEEIERTIVRPCIAGLAAEGAPYCGVLYTGVMITDQGPKVVEFNCRFGDPETQVIMPRMKSDLVPLLLACCDGTLDKHAVEWHDAACVTVVMASGGYPGAYEKGKSISGIEDAEHDSHVTVFHAGTRLEDGRLITNGGRVLNVTGTGRDIPAAIERAYGGVAKIEFDGAHWRTDIGAKALARINR